MSQSTTLVIGVTSRHGSAAWINQNTHNYLATLHGLGVTPVLLTPDTPARLPSGHVYTPEAGGQLNPDILHHLDGLILSGGGDVDPTYFGAELNGAEPDQIDRRRDELELNLARAALARDLPIFGICRGCQVLNIAAGGSMIQHLDGHRSPHDSTAYHDVCVEADARLRHIVGEDAFAVNTFHHQGMDRAVLAPIFRPAAMAHPDAWLVEAYESRTHRWVVGVQWHPERGFELGPAHRRLWESFISACNDRAAHRTP